MSNFCGRPQICHIDVANLQKQGTCEHRYALACVKLVKLQTGETGVKTANLVKIINLAKIGNLVILSEINETIDDW